MKVNYQTMPLRRITKREIQNGRPYVVLVCNHAAPGVPLARPARFYPCPVCHQLVDQAKRGR